MASGTVHSNGVEIAFESLGDGEPLLLIMGLAAPLVFWSDELCEGLVEKGFRVIRFDHRDVGLSTKLKDAGVPNIRRLIARRLLGQAVEAPYTLADLADDAAGLLLALEIESAHVVGTSMGGMVAQTLAIRHPEKVRTLTSIMSNTGALRHAVPHPKAMRMLLSGRASNPDAAIEEQVAFFRLVGSTRYAFDEDYVRARAVRTYRRAFYPAAVPRHLAAVIASGSRAAALPTVRAPTLVMHGTVDPLVRPPGGRATAQAIPGAKLRWFEGMGHDLPRELWPEIIAEISQHALAAGGS